jgi:hypothetical protein
LTKTVATLEERVADHLPDIDEAERALQTAEAELTTAAHDVVRRRLFTEPHLWNYALGREIGVRSKGFIGALYRLVESARTLPARLSSFSLWPTRSGAGHRAARLLGEGGLFEEHLDLSSDELQRAFESQASRVRLAMSQAGFAAVGRENEFETFTSKLGDAVETVLRGPGRDRVVARARALTSWPLAVALDIPAVGFFGYTAFLLVTDYFQGAVWTGPELVHAASVLGIIVIAEIFGLSATARFFAWNARRAASRDLRLALAPGTRAFSVEHQALDEARKMLEALRGVTTSVREAASK